MAKYKIIYMKTIAAEDVVDASDFDEAQAKWEAIGLDGELYSIEDEHGITIFYG